MKNSTMKGALQRWAGRLAAAATLGLAAAGPGQAAVYVGTFDPQFGAPFTSPFNLGWRGEVTLQVPTGCLGVNAIVSTFNGACLAAGGAQVLSAYVELFNWDNPGDLINPPQRLTLNASTIEIYDLQFDAAGNLIHLATSRSDTVTGAPFINVFGLGEKFFGLGFTINDDLCDGSPSCEALTPPRYSGAVLGFQNFQGECGETCVLADVRRFPPTLTFTPVPPSTVPVPATAALALAALAAAGVATARSRRRRAS